MVRGLAALLTVWSTCGSLVFGVSQGSYAPRFVQTLSVGPGTLGNPESIIYGNAEYGFFETREISAGGGQITTRLVPPGYKYPLAVYLKQRDSNGAVHLERMADARFTYPLGAGEYAPAPFRVEGDLTPPFFIGNGDVTVSGKPAHPAIIVNRQGEVVWLYLGPGGRNIHMGKPLGRGRFGFISLPLGAFDIAHFDGRVEEKFSYEGRLRLHHDFLYDGGDNLLAFTYRAHDFPGSPDSVLIPDRYAVGQVVHINLATHSPTLLWDAFDDGPWLHGPGWTPHLLLTVPIGNGIAPARRDFEHINSIDRFPGRGYLLSIKHFNTLVLVDEKFRFRWSLGSAPGTTIDTKGTPGNFRGEHHATFLPNGDILMFDNGTTRSRLLQLRVDDQSLSFSVVKEFVPRVPAFSTNRGSASPLPNGNMVGFFPRIPPRPDPSRIIEFDPQGNQSAMLEIPEREMAFGYRFVPLDAIGRESYLGSSPRTR